ncbi:MAG: minichromosome maintenance protein MCM, partial [Candidatus Woesearchaeota archaeon]
EINFKHLSAYDPELAHILLDTPEDLIKAGELAIDQFDLEKEGHPVRIRFKELPVKEKVDIRNIRSVHLNKFVVLDGVVRQKSDVRPQIEKAKFECPQCGTNQTLGQQEKTLTEPKKCHSCGYKGKFSLISKVLVDVQGLTLEESTSTLDGGEQPKRLNILLKEDLVSPMSEKKTNPGSNVRVNGILKEVAMETNNGGKKLVKYDLVLLANNVQALEEDYSSIKITPEEEKQIKDISEDPRVYDKLIASMAPGIYGHDRVKEAILYLFLGGVQKSRNDGVKNRGDTHMLLIGDPGSGKSQLLKRAAVIAPKGKYVSGKGASGAGLTASVVKDEFLGGWALEAGALVLANKGICLIDELDKMTTEDRSAMHEALEQQTITISKANIQATLKSETSVLAAANPRHGRFDPYASLADQINLPPALISRFDLIFPFRDEPDREKDDIMANFILNMHKNAEVKEPDIPTELLSKYIIYARQRIHPKLTESAMLEIKNFYVQMRNADSDAKAIPITARQLEALIRLSEASAKARLSEKATKRDAARAIDLLQFCLQQIGVDKETGKIDIDKLTTGVTSSQRGKLIIVRELLTELEQTLGKEIPIKELAAFAETKGIQKDELEEIVQKLRRNGDIFEPKPGYITKI